MSTERRRALYRFITEELALLGYEAYEIEIMDLSRACALCVKGVPGHNAETPYTDMSDPFGRTVSSLLE